MLEDDRAAFDDQLRRRVAIKEIDRRGEDDRHPPRSEVLSVLLQAGRGVVAAHAAGLVPRDLEPDNIMVGDDGRPAVSWRPILR
ncbi:MAG: hypothetical protein H6712_13895 [Myxococcales bacterium]|nr:hypothetical protein [Myxococcales bacterium]MCB9714954.1 hypothetical protein [Myxococcales bacterium]